MTAPGQLAHFLQHFFTDVRSRANQAVLYEKQGPIYRSVTLRETAARIADVVRALSMTQIQTGDRIVLYAAASSELLITEWAILTSRGVAVIAPRNFSPDELIATAKESSSKLVVVDRFATAYNLVRAAETLPELKQIICFEGSADAKIPIVSWMDFIDSGRLQPDRTGSLLNAIQCKDTALLFYYKEGSELKATRYTHALLLDHITRIEKLLGEATIQKGELVLTATAWEHAIGHIASCYAPIRKEASVQLTHALADAALFENGPQVTVGDAVFFDGVRQSILRIVRNSKIDSALLTKALTLSKQAYESQKMGPLANFQYNFLKSTILLKVRRILGSKPRLFIGTDNEASYETQLFFQTFGIELIELPQEAFR